jgi:hypothetical protein
MALGEETRSPAAARRRIGSVARSTMRSVVASDDDLTESDYTPSEIAQAKRLRREEEDEIRAERRQEQRRRSAAVRPSLENRPNYSGTKRWYFPPCLSLVFVESYAPSKA